MKNPHVRRGRPKAEVTASLRRITKQDWDRLVSATVLAQINQEYSVYLRVSYLLEFPEDFPAFRIVEKDGYENIVKFRTKVLMRWLIENGHTTLSMWDIQQAGRKFTLEQKEVDRMFSEEYYEGLEEPSECNELFEGEYDEQAVD